MMNFIVDLAKQYFCKKKEDDDIFSLLNKLGAQQANLDL